MKKIFVFGSNTEGRHGAGAALHAMKNHGAKYGCPAGLQGNSYAIVTKNLAKGLKSIPLNEIEAKIKDFILMAKTQPQLQFYVSAIGCGLAGYKPEEIGPMFKGCPSNVELCKEFQPFV